MPRSSSASNPALELTLDGILAHKRIYNLSHIDFAASNANYASASGYTGKRARKTPKVKQETVVERLREDGFRLLVDLPEELISVVLDSTATYQLFAKARRPAFIDVVYERRLNAALKQFMDATTRLPAWEERHGVTQERHLGHARGYGSPIKDISPLAFNKENANAIGTLLSQLEFKLLLDYVDSLLRRLSPRIHRLFRRCARRQPAGNKWLFGVYSTLTINCNDVEHVILSPHVDTFNVAAGLCCIVPFGSFDSKEAAYLVIWDLLLVVEMTAWSVAFLPSSLFIHCNVNLNARERRSFDVLNVRPSADLLNSPAEKRQLATTSLRRSSLVFYNQGNVFAYRANGDRTDKQVLEAGGDPSCMSNWSDYHLYSPL